MGVCRLRLCLMPFLAVLLASCGGDGVSFDVGAPVERPARPVPEFAFWGPANDIPIARSGAGQLQRRVLRINDVRRFFLDRVAWSPDGRRLAFTREAGLGYRRMDVWTVDAAGGGLRRATRTGDALWPLWAPDGRSIVYARLEDPGRNRKSSLDYSTSLWAIGPDGTNRRRLTDPTPGVTERPWSFVPDGSQLAITRARVPALERRAENTRLVLIDLDGSGERTLSGTATDPVFSPDGSRIAYASAHDRNGTLSYGDISSVDTELYVMDADGGNRRRLTRTRNINELAPSWSPAGTSITYTRGRQYQNAEIYSIWQVNPDGRCPQALFKGKPRGAWYASPVWRPGRGGEAREDRCAVAARIDCAHTSEPARRPVCNGRPTR